MKAFSGWANSLSRVGMKQYAVYSKVGAVLLECKVGSESKAFGLTISSW